jgi:hypothetical protein
MAAAAGWPKVRREFPAFGQFAAALVAELPQLLSPKKTTGLPHPHPLAAYSSIEALGNPLRLTANCIHWDAETPDLVHLRLKD